MSSLVISYQDITQAAFRINGFATKTPLLESKLVNERLGGRVLFKAECLQVTGSFKFRGAFNKLSKLASVSKLKGVVAYSSGNHAQGVAAAAAHFGVSATIVMPSDAPKIKIANTKALGANVVLYERNKEDRNVIGQRLSKAHDLILIPPYNDADIMAGQGTIGLAIAQQLNAMNIKCDQTIGPVGGGGLMSGSATALNHHFPGMHLWGAEPEGYDDAARSLSAGKILANEHTTACICDSIITPMVGDLPFPIMQRHLKGAKSASESYVLEAMNICMQQLKLVVEPGGCIGLAAILNNSLDVKDKTTVVILSGANADPAMLSRALSQ